MKTDIEKDNMIPLPYHSFASNLRNLNLSDEIMTKLANPDKSVEDVLELVKLCKIDYVQFWFTDILGELKSFSVNANELKSAFDENGLGFDGSSIEGLARIEESDVLASPDPKTFALLPWRSDGLEKARMICNIKTHDKKHEIKPHDGDPRRVLINTLKQAEKQGFRFLVGPEIEYFYFKNDDKPQPLDHGGYFSLVSNGELANGVRKYTAEALDFLGITVEYMHHEVAPSQHEVDLSYCEALKMADNTISYKLLVKEIASKFGIYASFMPKPILACNGNGMHVHQSLWDKKNNINLFYNQDDRHCLSDLAKCYIAGLLKHAPEITIVTNQWVNSYKRLVPGYEAPTYISWGQQNRSTLVRVPEYKHNKQESTRLEYRCPDSACNPYLVFAVMLAAGLEGIKKEYKLPNTIEKDIYQMSPSERDEFEITPLPDNLYDAIMIAQGSELLKKTLGEHIFEKLIKNKVIEWDTYKKHVSDFEIKRYFPML